MVVRALRRTTIKNINHSRSLLSGWWFDYFVPTRDQNLRGAEKNNTYMCVGYWVRKKRLIHFRRRNINLSRYMGMVVCDERKPPSTRFRRRRRDRRGHDQERPRVPLAVVFRPQDQVLVAAADHVADVRAEQFRERLRRHPGGGVVLLFPPFPVPVKEVVQRAFVVRDRGGLGRCYVYTPLVRVHEVGDGLRRERVRPPLAQDLEDGGQVHVVGPLLLLAAQEQVLERNRFADRRRMLHRRPDQAPPRREPCLHLGVARQVEGRVAEEDRVQRAHDPAAVACGPLDRVGVLEWAVLGVGAVGLEVRQQTARRQVAARGDVVADEDVD